MASSQQTVDELREQIEDMREQVEDLKEEYGLDDEDEETVNVEIPAAGRTNWEAGVGGSVELPTDRSSGETERVETEIPVAGRTNEETTTIKREVPKGRTMEDEQQAREELWQRIAEDERERERERQERMNEREQRSRELDPHMLSEDEAEEDAEIPPAGRTNWERYNEDDDE